MSRKSSKTYRKQEPIYFQGQSAQNQAHQNDKKDQDALPMMKEDPQQSPEQISSRFQQRPSRTPGEPMVKEEYSCSGISSLMDLDEIISDPQNEDSFQSEAQSESSYSIQNKRKSKRIRKNKKKTHKAKQAPAKVQKQDSLSKDGRKSSRYKGARKIRTTISEEKIKIMQYLFPYAANQEPYKGNVLTLKDIGKIVDLGYSTVLHKYKDYREKGEVQKGLLLVCKDFKRKYTKSLVIEDAIKSALKEKQFKTAKQLATYISEKYQLNVTRSIISRHLNQMQREKVTINNRVVQLPGLKKQRLVDAQTFKKMKEFCLVYEGLKGQKVQFQYLLVIRLYLVENKVSLSLEKKTKKFTIVNLTVTATESRLKEFYLNSIDSSELLEGKNLSYHDSFTYKALYNQLQIEAQNDYFNIEFDNEERAFIVYPYKHKVKQSDYRIKVLAELIDKKVCVLTVPPDCYFQKINFVEDWFETDVMPLAAEMKFENYASCREKISSLMINKQKSLESFASIMQNNIKNF